MSAYNCSDPSALSNGYFVIAKPYYVDGDRVYYYCQWTYFLQGNPIRECDGDTGNWTGKAPTCTTTTTTSTTEAPVNEWVYMSISLSSFLALVFICLVSVAILKYCHILCRQRTRVKDDEEEVETGCCYTCCIHCFASGCRGCFTVRNVTPRPSEYPPSPRPSVRSVSIQAEEIPTLSLEEVVTSKRMAKELKNYWKPHRHDLRNNNQSTK
uniref:Uncharacterized protein LOC111110564 isoform X1 n=1 Tax=Crassostrea virginica TaxID=6565 RepID=A0A8B8BIP9_CRAVI|nr:uncharacterized protein LOC111110564 isoform X1 [Crassostrea virginica]